jgi:hypothetical protein
LAVSSGAPFSPRARQSMASTKAMCSLRAGARFWVRSRTVHEESAGDIAGNLSDLSEGEHFNFR